eukprot:g8730.t1
MKRAIKWAPLIDGMEWLPSTILSDEASHEKKHILMRKKRDVRSRRKEIAEKRTILVEESVTPVGSMPLNLKKIVKSKSAPDLAVRRKVNLPPVLTLPRSRAQSLLRKDSLQTPEHTGADNARSNKSQSALRASIRKSEYDLRRKEEGYDRMVLYIEKPVLSAHKRRDELVQETWLKLIPLIQGAKVLKQGLRGYREELEDQRALNAACARIQSTFRGAFVRKANRNLERISMLLRQKAWIAKLNVRTGKRKRSASVVRRFTKAAVAVGKFSTVVRKYRNRIIFLQRFIRSFFVCQHARQAAMSKAWRVKEADIVAKQTIEDAKLQAEYKAREEKLAKKRAKKAKKEMINSGEKDGAQHSGREIKMLIKGCNKLSRSLDQVSFRTRPGADDDPAIAMAMQKEEKRRKQMAMKRRTSKKIRNKLLANYLRKKRIVFINDELASIGNINEINPKLSKEDMELVLKGGLDPSKLIKEKRMKIERLRNSRMLLIYTNLSKDLPKLVRAGLEEQKRVDIRKLKRALS